MFGWFSRLKKQPLHDAVTDEKVTGQDYIHLTAKDIIDKYFQYLETLEMTDLYAELDAMEEELPEFESALDTIADTATQGERGDEYTFQIKASNSELVANLEALYERIGLHDTIWGTARDLVKYGNEFDLINTQDDLITELETLPVYVMRRKYITDAGKPKDMFVRVAFDDEDTVLQEYSADEVIHWRWKVPRSGFIRSNEYYPPLYGRGLGLSFLKTYRKLLLMEDSLILGRLTRAIAKIVYKLDVGALQGSKAEEYIKRRKAELGRKKYIDAVSGRLSETTNPLQDEDDIFIETRPGSASDVKALNLAQNAQWVGDVQYIQNKLFCALRTPKGYLNFEKDLNARATLLKQDVQYGRWIRRLQTALTYGIKELSYRQLAMQSTAFSKRANAAIKQARFILRDSFTLVQVNDLKNLYASTRDIQLITDQILKGGAYSDREIEAVLTLIDKAANLQEMATSKPEFDIVFPAVSVDDELTKAQVDATKSKVAIVLASLALMSRKDILTQVFSYTEDEAEELIAAANEDYTTLPRTKKKTVKDAAQAILSSFSDDLRTVYSEEFIKHKQSQEHAVDNA